MPAEKQEQNGLNQMSNGPTESGIYCISNKESERIYVGCAANIRARWACHRTLLRQGGHHSRILQRSWNKHGESAFLFKVLEIVVDQDMLIEREQFWIDTLNAACPIRGLNSAPLAGRVSGFKWAPDAEGRERLAARRRGTKVSDETRAKMSATRKGRPWPKTPEHRASLSAARKGSKNPLLAEMNRSPEHRARVSAARRLSVKRGPENPPAQQKEK